MENGTFKTKLRELRKSKNETQQELATAIGVTRGSVANWEAGLRVPDLNTLSAVARHFGVSVDTLANGEDYYYSMVGGAVPSQTEKDPTTEVSGEAIRLDDVERTIVMLLREIPESRKDTVASLVQTMLKQLS